MDFVSTERDGWNFRRKGQTAKDLEERKAELKKQCYEEDIKLEEEFNAELVQLIEKYKPPH